MGNLYTAIVANMKIAFIILYLFVFHVESIAQTDSIPDSPAFKDSTKSPLTDSIGIPKGQTT